MFFPEPAHFEQQDIEMQLLKIISKKQLGEECASSRAAPKPPQRGGARPCPQCPGLDLLGKASVGAPGSPSPSSHCFPPNPKAPFPGATRPHAPLPQPWEGLGFSRLRLVRVWGRFVFLLRQVVRRECRERSGVSWPDGLEFGSWIRPVLAIAAGMGSWHLPCPPTAGRPRMLWIPGNAPVWGSPEMLRIPWDALVWGPWGCSSSGGRGDASAPPRGWSPGQDAAPEAALLGVVQRSEASEEGVHGGPFLGCRGPGARHGGAAPAAAAMLRAPLSPHPTAWLSGGWEEGPGQAQCLRFSLSSLACACSLSA